MSKRRFLPPTAALASAVAMGERPSPLPEVSLPPSDSTSPVLCSGLVELSGLETQEESRTVLSAAASRRQDARRKPDVAISRFTGRPSNQGRTIDQMIRLSNDAGDRDYANDGYGKLSRMKRQDEDP